MYKIKLTLLLFALMSSTWSQLPLADVDSEEIIKALTEIETLRDQHILFLITNIGGNDGSVEVIDGYPTKKACDSSGPYFVREVENGLENTSNESNGRKPAYKATVDFKCLPKFPALATD